VITDTHAHLFWKSYDEDRGAVLERARAAGVGRILIVGTDVATSRAAFELCAGRRAAPPDARSGGAPSLFPSAGIHPHDAAGVDAAMRAEIRELCSRDDCVAVGETGLDYFKNFSPRAEQRDNFRWHIELAAELEKPLIVHCRDAHEETVELLRGVPGVRGVMHCYTTGEAELAPYLELGFYISFSGVVTYPRNEENRKAAIAVPSDRLLFETDSPFLAPQGERGKRNEPAFVRRVLEEVASLRGSSAEELASRTSRNAAQLFGLPSV
jgi:TatD DNase family protein